MPHSATAVATFCGSFGSEGGGALEVFTAQKRQPRVQVSPINMIVAVAACDFPSLPSASAPALADVGALAPPRRRSTA